MNKEFRVGDQHRTNPLSHEEGGRTITVLKENGQLLTYDKIKNFRAYISNMNMDGVLEVKVDGELYYTSNPYS